MEYRTKEEQVADYLREAILAGHFPRGTRLKQAEIAKTLQISITPVREALKLLEAEGYISGSSYKGAVVAPLDVAASVETLNLRILLEGQLIRHAVEKATTDDLRLIRRSADEFAEAVNKRDSAEARAANYRFHKQMYVAADLPQTLHFVQILWARYPFDVINRVEGRAFQAVEEHEALLRPMIEGDLTGAMLALRRHIEAGWATVNEAMERKPAAPADPGAQPRRKSNKETGQDERSRAAGHGHDERPDPPGGTERQDLRTDHRKPRRGRADTRTDR
ncbi:GntR family transcriptional regulator [Pararoseomonas indoligenes]|uniref:GntR family transcriptional regulator n=1 Tax=Roseomonas indoligenes TaxID=2820811 RepID=A0A940N4Z1_9PROT|nr:GntR family transcriptional regulator [Pararoseomonas indoligenes]